MHESRKHLGRGTWLVACLVVLTASLLTAPAGAISLYAAYWDTNDLGEAAGAGVGLTFGGKFALDLAGTYYEELDDDPVDLIQEGDSPFASGGFDVIPIDAGFRFTSGSGRGGGLYLGIGATLFLIDSNAEGVEVDDEAGWYAKAGWQFGGGRRGPAFFVEGLLRRVDTEVGLDLGIIDEPSPVEIDLEGVSIHVGVRF